MSNLRKVAERLGGRFIETPRVVVAKPVVVHFEQDRSGVRAGVWDYVCVPGVDEKDGIRTEFNARTLTEMVRNFESRGDRLALDYDHQSQKVSRNGQPAPALGFYGALAVVSHGQIIRTAHARGMNAPSTSGIDRARDGLWAYRSEVTDHGRDLLRSYGMLSPTFTPEGVARDGSAIGYQLLGVAATNVPWQSGTQITR